jgi:hypothetical protein
MKMSTKGTVCRSPFELQDVANLIKQIDEFGNLF